MGISVFPRFTSFSSKQPAPIHPPRPIKPCPEMRFQPTLRNGVSKPEQLMLPPYLSPRALIHPIEMCPHKWTSSQSTALIASPSHPMLLSLPPPPPPPGQQKSACSRSLRRIFHCQSFILCMLCPHTYSADMSLPLALLAPCGLI